ncbi:hypothetical protein ATO10_05322 [Actibacterium atlanticum]|uniref:Uncharacterized protein n=1 Tax=Actibacterium atlanticum TaxID=1461693 RepID=A0A058ZN05_9RHOB|nr:MbcA/ParS/Xre antitoxin family protein [Actibacterium atlanticum]KCV83004.1 hypothetical protein ATO10_05322 [Actibacterium atlanticum]
MRTQFNSDRGDQPDPNAVLTKAVMRAASLMDVSQVELAAILGLSEAKISAVAKHGAVLPDRPLNRNMAAYFVRIFRSLDAIVGGDQAVAASWLRNHNVVLGHAPIDAMKSVAGLVHVMDYLDQRRAPL